jgi:drug/metabolite transporter (DMT)-like permease
MLGITYGLMAAALYASDVLINKFIKDLPGLDTTIVQLATASLILLPYVIFTGKLNLTHLDGRSWLLLIIVSIVHTGIAYILYFTAIKSLKGQTIAVLCYIDPISAIIMSSVFLGEKLTVVQIFGGILILGTTFLNEFDYKNVYKRGILWWRSEKL